MSFDLTVEQALFAIRTPSGIALWSFISDFAGATVVIAITCLALYLLHSGRKWNYAAGLLLSLGGSVLFATILKYIIERPRPPLYMHAVVESSYSFPSSHAAAAIALYGFLAYSAEHLIAPRWRAVFVALCLILILAIGFSRLYLGVHYPTDVLGGYLVGAVFLVAGSKLAKALARFTR